MTEKVDEFATASNQKTVRFLAKTILVKVFSLSSDAARQY
jgi:hypothetical protein